MQCHQARAIASTRRWHRSNDNSSAESLKPSMFRRSPFPIPSVEAGGTPPAAHVASRSDLKATLIGSRLSWNRAYRVASYLRSSLWFAPVVAIVLIYLLVPLLRLIDSHLG